MRTARLKVITPLGEFYSQSADVCDDYDGTTDEDFYQGQCKSGTYFQLTLEDGMSEVYLPREMIQQSIFVMEVREKGEEEL